MPGVPSQWPLGLGAIITSPGTGCTNGGLLTAVCKPGVKGSGFSASFAVAYGAATSVSVIDAGSGYETDATANVTIRIEVGGDGCTNVSFAPFLVYDPDYLV